MRAAVYFQAGKPDVLRYIDVPQPVCGADEVLIKVEAIALEGGDVINRATAAPSSRGTIPGYSAAGTIVAVGKNVQNRQPGQRVATIALNGSHAQYRAAPAAWSWVIPDGLDVVTAAAIPVSFGTAAWALSSRLHLQAGETLLIQGGAGGVGVAAIQLAKARGARVLATLSGSARVAKLHELGLDVALDYRQQDIVAEVQTLTQQRGVDSVLDLVGSTLELSFACLREGGTVVLAGNAGGSTRADLAALQQANQTLSGLFWGRELANEQARASVDGLLAQARDGVLRVLIDREFALQDVVEAHRYAEENRVLGRIILRP
ncbi:quinone oxidoreductase family protein [Kosakonia oryzae]|uniref:NADPH:quinone reductase n=1 Tax=Kosakonia oryzae TaxID=497725 RepID=A0AA94KPR7_9ENTR|nr:zinc-binding alcohol dehydrogenase family protein [Kosakonia oryzae]ANI82707.1 zinc-binding alcohol dehydrogenase family protein [Kosakonia oryzae]SFC23642.1 NADPH:quinone reductase [Kosakonia oryzae]